MKKRFLSGILALVMIMIFLPVGSVAVASGEFKATLTGELDADVNDMIGERGLGDLPEATVEFNLYEPATIRIEFDEPVKFTGSRAAIETNVPVNGDYSAMIIGGQILSIIINGRDLGSRPVMIVDRDREGLLTFDFTRQWDGTNDPYELAGMDTFTSIEITFVVGHIATIMEEPDSDTDAVMQKWERGEGHGAILPVVIGQFSSKKISFDEPVSFTGSWTGLVTSVPVISEEDAESTGAFITSLIIDGNDLGSRMVPLTDRDGFLTIELAQQGENAHDEYGLAGMEPFTSLEIVFIVPSLPEGEGASEPGPVELPSRGHAWIAGTVKYTGRTDDVDPGLVEWYEFKDQSVGFEIGVPFTVILDLNNETATHDDAHWEGFFMCVETDINFSETYFTAFIDKIIVDGRELRFDAENVAVDKDRGIRIPLTSSWDETPLGDHSAIGTFSRIEIKLVIGETGVLVNPFITTEDPVEETTTPPPATAPVERPEPTPLPTAGLPGWMIPAVVGTVVVIAAVVILIVSKSTKKRVK